MGLLPAKYSVQKLWPQINNVFCHCFKSMGIVHVLSVGCVCEHPADQGLFWQKPWSLHTSKSEAAHLGKCSGSIWNGEACAKDAFLRIQDENEPMPSLKVCITGLVLAACEGWEALQAGLNSPFRFALQFWWLAAHSCELCLCNAHFPGSLLWFLSLNDGRRHCNDFSFVGLALSSEYTRYSSGLHAWVMCWALDLFTRSARTEIGSVFQSSSWALVCSPLWWFSNPRS